MNFGNSSKVKLVILRKIYSQFFESKIRNSRKIYIIIISTKCKFFSLNASFYV